MLLRLHIFVLAICVAAFVTDAANGVQQQLSPVASGVSPKGEDALDPGLDEELRFEAAGLLVLPADTGGETCQACTEAGKIWCKDSAGYCIDAASKVAARKDCKNDATVLKVCPDDSGEGDRDGSCDLCLGTLHAVQIAVALQTSESPTDALQTKLNKLCLEKGEKSDSFQTDELIFMNHICEHKDKKRTSGLSLVEEVGAILGEIEASAICTAIGSSGKGCNVCDVNKFTTPQATNPKKSMQEFNDIKSYSEDYPLQYSECSNDSQGSRPGTAESLIELGQVLRSRRSSLKGKRGCHICTPTEEEEDQAILDAEPEVRAASERRLIRGMKAYIAGKGNIQNGYS